MMSIRLGALLSVLALFRAANAAGATRGPVPEGVLVDTAVERAVVAGLGVTDHQIVERPEGRAEFHRSAYRVEGDPEGIPVDALPGIEFDPSRQDVVVHWVRIRRGSEVREMAPKLRFDKPQSPGDPGAIWCDRLQVREGDIVDRAWSVVDRVPLRGGADFGEADNPFQSEGDWTRLRLVWNRPDSLRVRSPEAFPFGSERSGSGRILTWRGAASVVPDRVEWSSFRRWSEVGDWLAPWFSPTSAPGPLVSAAVAGIRTRESGEEGRIVAALQRAQALEEDGMSVGGFRIAGLRPPKDPEAVLRSGRGDAADKAMVLLAILRGLGLEAEVVAAPRWGVFLGGRLERPSNALDRFLVKVRTADQTFLLDPMGLPSVGGLALRSTWSDALILPLGPSSPGFVSAPTRPASAPDLDLRVEVDAASFDAPSKVAWNLTSRGEFAARIKEDRTAWGDLHGVLAATGGVLPTDGGGEVTEGDESVSTDGTHDVEFWRTLREDWRSGMLVVAPVANLMDRLRESIDQAQGFRLEATRMRGVFVVNLPEGASDEDSLHSTIGRAGVRFDLGRSVRDGVLRVEWEFSSSAFEAQGDSAVEWLGTLDSIRKMGEVEVEQDRRNAIQRVVDAAGLVRWGFAGFFAIVVVASAWAGRIVWRRNPTKREVAYGKRVATMPSWWRLYPVTLALSAAWALWGLVETLPGVLGLDDGPYRSVPFLERLMEFQACSARLFVLPGFLLLFRLFRARRSSFRGLNTVYLLIGSLWFLLEAWLRLGYGRIDLFRVFAMVGLFALWPFWMAYFSRSILARSVFRTEWAPSKDGEGDPIV